MNRNYTQFHGKEIIDEGQHDVSWKEVRKERDKALTDSDWRAVKDRTLPYEWKLYRTFLRDLPGNYDSANEAADAWSAYEIPE